MVGMMGDGLQAVAVSGREPEGRKAPSVGNNGVAVSAVEVVCRTYSPANPPGGSVQEKQPRTFRHVLIRVMAMQVVTLAVFGWLQYRYGR
jgi:hypothetical protein